MATPTFQPFAGDIAGDPRRIEPRTQLSLPAMLHVEGGMAVPGAVSDITTRGCRLETAGDAPAAAYVTIVIAHATMIGGRVAWREDGVIGIDFCARLMPKAIGRILALGLGAAEPVDAFAATFLPSAAATSPAEDSPST